MTTPRDDIAGLSERLKSPVWNEDTMQQWDSWREMIAKMPGASLPRDCFESFLDGVDEERAEAATAIDALQARVKELEAALNCKRDAISEYIVGDDKSELAQARASEAYMSAALSREIEIAQEAESRALRAEQERDQALSCCDSYVNENQQLHDRMEKAQQERDEAYERAAKVADALVCLPADETNVPFSETKQMQIVGRSMAARSIAAAIRHLAGPDKEGE